MGDQPASGSSSEHEFANLPVPVSSIVQRLSISASKEPPEIVQQTPAAMTAINSNVRPPALAFSSRDSIAFDSKDNERSFSFSEHASVSNPQSPSLSPTRSPVHTPAAPPPLPPGLLERLQQQQQDSLAPPNQAQSPPRSPRSITSSASPSSSPSVTPTASPRRSPRGIFALFTKAPAEPAVPVPVLPTDHLALANDPDVAKLLNQHARFAAPVIESVRFSEVVTKFNETNSTEQRVLLITNCAMYNLKRNRLSHSRRRIPLHQISRVTTSSTSDQVAVSIQREHSYRCATDKKAEIVRVLTDAFPVSLTSPRLNNHLEPPRSPTSQSHSRTLSTDRSAFDDAYQLDVDVVAEADLQPYHVTKDGAAKQRQEEYEQNVRRAQEELNETKVVWAQKARERERRKAEAAKRAREREQQRQKQLEAEMEAIAIARARQARDHSRGPSSPRSKSPRPQGDPPR